MSLINRKHCMQSSILVYQCALAKKELTKSIETHHIWKSTFSGLFRFFRRKGNWWLLFFSRSRKRRTSETLMDDEETMTECSAAMLLMKLSCSPHSTQFATSLPTFDQFGRPNFPINLPSPVESSGSSSFRSATPSPPLSSSTGTSSTADEGIVKDLFEISRSRSNSNKPVWTKKCTFYVGLGLQSLYRPRA